MPADKPPVAAAGPSSLKEMAAKNAKGLGGPPKKIRKKAKVKSKGKGGY